MYVYTHMLCEEHTQTYIYTQTHKYIHTDSHTYVQKRKHKTNTHAPTLFSLPYTLRPHSPLPPSPPYTYSGQQHQPHSSTARQSSGPSGDRVGSPSRVFCWSHAKKRKWKKEERKKNVGERRGGKGLVKEVREGRQRGWGGEGGGYQIPDSYCLHLLFWHLLTPPLLSFFSSYFLLPSSSSPIPSLLC